MISTITTINQTTSSAIQQDNNFESVIEYIVPKGSFEKKLSTIAGLKQHVNLLERLYNDGIASSWQNSIQTDTYLLPRILEQIRKKYPDINLIILELGFDNLELEITKLINNNVVSAKFVFGVYALGVNYNHFVMADYYLDTSSPTHKASVIFFNAGSENYNLRYLLIKSNQIVSMKKKFLIKFLYISLDIQKSNVDCLFFSLELAKAAYKSSAEIQQLHLLYINDELTENSNLKEKSLILSARKPIYKFDCYIPFNMMKHCQSSKRIAYYINTRKNCGDNTEIALNKKQESLEARCKRFTRVKKFAYLSGDITTSFSIENERLRVLKKIIQELTELS